MLFALKLLRPAVHFRDFSVVREERAFFSEGMQRLGSGHYLQNDGHVLPAKVKPSKGSELEDEGAIPS
jgi:hypothetical protein